MTDKNDTVTTAQQVAPTQPIPGVVLESTVAATMNLTPADLRPLDPNTIRAAEYNGTPSIPFLMRNDGNSQEVQALERLFQAPHRPRGTTELQNADDFIEYVKRMNGENTQLFYTADKQCARFTAVFNAHTKDSTGWHDHRAIYGTQYSDEWKTWSNNDKTGMSQVQFAEFIEVNRRDVLRPDAATMLKVIETMQANKSVKFTGAVRMQNGDQKLSFEHTSAATAGAKGELVVPDEFTIGIPVFLDDIRYEVNAHFRYRVSDEGKLTIHYQLINREQVLDHAIKQVVAKISEGTALYAFRGTPITPISALA